MGTEEGNGRGEKENIKVSQERHLCAAGGKSYTQQNTTHLRRPDPLFRVPSQRKREAAGSPGGGRKKTRENYVSL